MKILVISDELPFPPHNGVSIPVSGYITLLQENHDVDFLLLQNTSSPINAKWKETTKNNVSNFFSKKRTHHSILKSTINEFLHGIPTFHSWDYDDINPEKFSMANYDVIIASPISALDFAINNSSKSQTIIAAISDCYTGVLSHSKPNFHDFGSVLRYIVRKIRSIRMAKIESQLLSNCQSVLVQTKKDKKWIQQIGGDELEVKTAVLSNGVSDKLIKSDLSDDIPALNVLFVANFSAEVYRNNIVWFYREVWLNVIEVVPNAKLRVVGLGLENYPAIKTMLDNDPTVTVEGFLPELEDVYNNCRLSVAPIFKDYGFINKVAESLASGVPVVGDKSAFNGMNSVIGSGCVFEANNSSEFRDNIVRLLSDEKLWYQASSVAIKEARGNFSWQSKKSLLTSLLK